MKKSILAGLLLAIGASGVSSANAILPTPPATTAIQIQNIAPPPLVAAIAQKPVTKQTLNPAIYAFLVRQDANGGETLTPVVAGTPLKKGDVVEYQGYFSNQTGERIRRAAVSLNIPTGVELVGGILPLGATASVDGKKFFRVPMRARMDGQIQNLPFRFYKVIRWQVEDLGLDGVAVVKYRAVLK